MPRVLKVYRVQQGSRALLVLQVNLDRRVLLVLQDQLVPLDLWDLPGPQDSLDHRDREEKLVRSE